MKSTGKEESGRGVITVEAGNTGVAFPSERV
jgi:hypothetical protein